MKMTTTLGTLLALSALTSTASAQIWSEGFEAGSNEGNWEAYWSNVNSIEPTGGNPGAYLRLDNTSASGTCHWVELFPNTWPAGFSGDWRGAGVDSVGLDVNVQVGVFTTIGAWSFIIGNDNGTHSDDCTLEFISPQMPPGAPGWTSFDFPVPTSSTTLPSGWIVDGACAIGVDAMWNYVIQDVDYVRFRMDTDPTVFCAFGTFWDVGFDNIRVEGTIPATPYCFGDGSGTACPCGNFGAADEGCANGGGTGASLAPSGTSSVGLDDLSFDLTKASGPVPAVLFTGTQQVSGGSGAVFGNGLRCAGGAFKRLGVKICNGAGSATWGPGMAQRGGWLPGDTRYFQGWFRDVSGPCNGQFNTSHGVGVLFLP